MFRRYLPRALAAILAGAALFASSPGIAGEKALVSTLPTLPAPRDRTDPPKDYGVTGLTVREHESAARSYLELAAATSRGYCIVDGEVGFRLESSTTALDSKMELWRFVEADGKATLERTRFEVSSYLKSAWTKSKTSVELREVARSNDVSVWGFRDAASGEIVLLARGANGGREVRPKKADEAGSFDFVSSECAFGAARLPPSAAKVGALVQLRGTLPPVGEGKAKITPQFVVDGSLAKLTRDPEPVLSVRVRMID